MKITHTHTDIMEVYFGSCMIPNEVNFNRLIQLRDIKLSWHEWLRHFRILSEMDYYYNKTLLSIFIYILVVIRDASMDRWAWTESTLTLVEIEIEIEHEKWSIRSNRICETNNASKEKNCILRERMKYSCRYATIDPCLPIRTLHYII